MNTPLKVAVVTGAGTGTFALEAASGIWGELQAGSYLFMDADYAPETSNLSRASILQQAGNAMVAQANQLPLASVAAFVGGDDPDVVWHETAADLRIQKLAIDMGYAAPERSSFERQWP